MRACTVVDHALLGDLAAGVLHGDELFLMPSFCQARPSPPLSRKHHGRRGAGAAVGAKHRPVMDRLRRRDRGIGIAHLRSDDGAALDDALGLDAKERRRP